MESLWGNDDFSLGHDDFSMGMVKRFKAIEAIFVKKCVFLRPSISSFLVHMHRNFTLH